MAVRNVEDAKKCAETMVAVGIRRVIITLGANGSLLAGRGLSEHVQPFAVKSVDSSGAGDAFIGSFAVFLAEGVPELEAVRRANLYAGLSTTALERKNPFMIARASMRNGQFEGETGPSPRRRSLTSLQWPSRAVQKREIMRQSIFLSHRKLLT
jgi:hypothetical protein